MKRRIEGCDTNVHMLKQCHEGTAKKLWRTLTNFVVSDEENVGFYVPGPFCLFSEKHFNGMMDFTKKWKKLNKSTVEKQIHKHGSDTKSNARSSQEIVKIVFNSLFHSVIYAVYLIHFACILLCLSNGNNLKRIESDEP